MEDIEINGHVLKKGHIVMAPSYIAHLLDPYWETERYPVKDFCPERFLDFGEKVEKGDASSEPTFVAGTKGSKMFPYGGGTAICPGRFFAKQEIMAAVALIVLNFDLEVLGFTNMDGTPSARRPHLDAAYHGAGVSPPDRDIKIRLRRR